MSTPPALHPPRHLRTVATILAIGTALFALQYLRPGMPDGFIQQLDVFRAHSGWFRLHLVLGAIALAIGPFQFNAALRARRPRLHRWLGRIYAACCGMSGIAGLYLAGLSYAGWATHVAFYGLAAAWLLATANAVRLILAGEVAAHRRWMIRSYALTFAAVTLRLWLVGFVAAGASFETAYIAASWLGWVPNLIAAEFFLRRERARLNSSGG